MDNANKLNRKCNQETIPRIKVERFWDWDLVIDVAKGAEPVEVESEVAKIMEKRTT